MHPCQQFPVYREARRIADDGVQTALRAQSRLAITITVAQPIPYLKTRDYLQAPVAPAIHAGLNLRAVSLRVRPSLLCHRWSAIEARVKGERQGDSPEGPATRIAAPPRVIKGDHAAPQPQ